MTFTGGGALAGAQNVSYFLSDGEPNEGNPTAGIDAGEETTWKTFLISNHVTSFAFGFGDVGNIGALNPVAYDGNTSTDLNAVLVTDLGQLTTSVVSTIPPPISGSLLSGAGSGFGADGGHVNSITVNGTTYTFNSGANSITVTGGPNNGSFNTGSEVLSVTTALGGIVAVNMLTGGFTYTPPSSIASTLNESVGFVLIDNDGDLAGNTLGITINNADAAPLVRDDHVFTNAVGLSAAIAIPSWTLLANDVDPDGQVITVTATSNSSDGTASPASGSPITTVTFTDNGDGDGGTFRYTGSTTAPAGSDTGDVTVTRVSGNTISGDGLADILISGNGNANTLIGYGGDDVMVGGSGNDTIWGDWTDENTHTAGGGDDFIYGGLGADVIHGGLGNDTIWGDLGNDSTAGGGNDVLYGGFGDDVIHGESGNDTIWGDTSNDSSTGGGNDTLYGGVGADVLHGESGNDVLWGDLGTNATTGGGADLLYGGAGADYLHGESGNDTLWGDLTDAGAGGGNDTLDGGAGDDQLHGGTGVDVIDLSDGTAGINFALDTTVGAHSVTLTTIGLGTDTYQNMEGVIGTNFADTLTGSTSADVLYGGSGNDSIVGGGGNDSLSGDLGNDTLSGGVGSSDSFHFDLHDLTVPGANDGADHITDWEKANDSLNFTNVLDGPGNDLNDLETSISSIVQSGGNTTVNFKDGGSVAFDGVTGMTFANATSVSDINQDLADLTNNQAATHILISH